MVVADRPGRRRRVRRSTSSGEAAAACAPLVAARRRGHRPRPAVRGRRLHRLGGQPGRPPVRRGRPVRGARCRPIRPRRLPEGVTAIPHGVSRAPRASRSRSTVVDLAGTPDAAAPHTTPASSGPARRSSPESSSPSAAALRLAPARFARQCSIVAAVRSAVHWPDAPALARSREHAEGRRDWVPFHGGRRGDRQPGVDARVRALPRPRDAVELGALHHHPDRHQRAAHGRARDPARRRRVP